MKESDFTKPGPLLLGGPDTEERREPSLSYIIFHYYLSHDMNITKAKELTDEYIKKFIEETK